MNDDRAGDRTGDRAGNATGNVSGYAPDQIRDSQEAAGHLGRGAAWMVAMRWAVRLVGVVSTIILARLLAPEDFGVMAIAMLVVAFVEVLAESGQHGALIRHREDTPDLYNAAWTLSVLQGVALSAVVLLAAPLGAIVFDAPEAQAVIAFLALRPLLLGFVNIGVVAYMKELNFRREFQFRVLEKAVTFVITIGLAFTLRNHWALAIGVVSGAFVQMALSYWLHPFKPRFSVARMGELISYSLHILVQAVTWFGWRRSDEFMVASVAGTGAMGQYVVAGNLATAPVEEAVLPAVRAVYPVYTRLRDDARALRDTYLLVFAAISAVVLPASVGIALVADDLVPVLLGPQWLETIGIIRWLALAVGLSVIAHSSETLLNATGLERRATQLCWLRLALFVPAVVVAGRQGDVELIAFVRCLIALFVLPAFIAVAATRTGTAMADYAAVLWRPVLATLAMTVLLWWLADTVQTGPAARLAILIAAGAVAYSGTLMAAWYLAGRPAGPEQSAVAVVHRRLLGRRD